MQSLFSLSEASVLDHRLIAEEQLSESALIDHAALGAFRIAEKELVGKSVLFLVGKGNNGSDALEMARLCLGVSAKVLVYLLSEKGNAENLRRRKLLPPSVFVEEILPSDTIVDGLFGFGFHGDFDEKTKGIVETVNHSSSFVLSLDVPSGFALRADLTVTFMCRKAPLYDPKKRGNSGEIVLFNPGFPEEKMEKEPVSRHLLEESDYLPLVLKGTEYKNTRGHLLVVGGSDRYPGAPILSSLSAFHAGCGLVTLSSVPGVLDKAFASYPSIMCQRKESLDLSRYSSIVVGPGWDEGDRDLLLQIARSGKPTVIDADAIRLMAELDFKGKGVITPHLGEFRKLKAILGVPESETEAEMKEVAGKTGCVVVLKAASLWITDGETLYVYDGLNPSLGVAGSGDTLAGIIGSLLARGEKTFQAAVQGVILHQKCGRILSERLGYYPIEDLIGEIGRNR